MLHSLYRAGLFAALFGLLLVPGATWGQDIRVRHVQDDAHLFSMDAVNQANAVIKKIHDRHGKDLFIETVAEGPEKDFAKWARARFDNFKMDGVYVVISKKPRKFQIEVGNKTLDKGYFTIENRKELADILREKQSDDGALKKVVNYTLDTMDTHHKPKADVAQPRANAPAAVVHRGAGENTMPPWVGWVCLIVGVLLVVWIVFAIIRAMTGAMGGGYGPGYGGGYGGGGGGFFTGMLGGLFGAMAGMWIYNNLFGGHATYGANGAVNWGGGDSGGAEGTAGGDTGVGTEEGGDYGGGDDAGGGGADAGGGGDWGGGDAGGGGGDDGGGGGGWFGGGGGDAGGGGGGDWGGGGGGGDWGGGGGGDFGGGGGGGDW